MQIKEFITKLQNLPESKKKIVVWTIVIVLGLVMGFFWIRGAMNSLQKLGESTNKIELPEIQTPTENSDAQTADWKTYTNTEYGFEFKYPEDWALEDSFVGGQDNFLDIHIRNVSISDDDPACDEGFIGSEMQVGKTKNPKEDFKLAVENFIRTDWMGPEGSIIKELTINGHLYLEIYPSGADTQCESITYFIEQNENYYTRLSWANHIDKQKESSEILEKMISTFKFTK